MTKVIGNLILEVDDEQIDSIVVDHCIEAHRVCSTVLDLEIKAMQDKNYVDCDHNAANVCDYLNYVSALKTVIAYFGGPTNLEG